FIRFFCFVFTATLLSGSEPVRTLLVEVRDAPAVEREEGGRFFFGGENRRRMVSQVRDNALLFTTKGELAQWEKEGFEARLLMESDDELMLYRRAALGASLKLDPVYHSYDEIVQRAEELMKQYPGLMSRIEIGRTTHFSRPIYAYRLSNNASEQLDRPGILFDGSHHSSELMGAEIVTALMERFVGSYGIDSDVTKWMDTLEIYLVPVVNVDGHDMVTSGRDPRWRKNLRDVNGDGVVGVYPEGVDVNRNYDFNWAKGGSSEPDFYSYRGAHPFSEAENRAMRHLVEMKNFVLSISYHSQGEVIYYPWTWGGRAAPDDALIKQIASDIAGSIQTMSGDGTYGYSPGGAASQSFPWFYGRYGTFDFIVETGKGAHIFPPEEVPGIIAVNLPGAYALLNHAAGPGLSIQVSDAKTGKPLKAEVWFPRIENEMIGRRRSDSGFGRSWRLLNPGTYKIIVSQEGYKTVVLPKIDVMKEGWTPLNVLLKPVGGGG
ncbi:MAG: hypothetical protein JKY51_02595, partial [Opitutaceae bacterium]|nr:hypothetical protein [Opitutaceae bacterium]